MLSLQTDTSSVVLIPNACHSTKPYLAEFACSNRLEQPTSTMEDPVAFLPGRLSNAKYRRRCCACLRHVARCSPKVSQRLPLLSQVQGNNGDCFGKAVCLHRFYQPPKAKCTKRKGITAKIYMVIKPMDAIYGTSHHPSGTSPVRHNWHR